MNPKPWHGLDFEWCIVLLIFCFIVLAWMEWRQR